MRTPPEAERSLAGVTDMEIKNIARLMDFGTMSKNWKNNNGNTNNGWPTF
jgi:hypothetical protein